MRLDACDLLVVIGAVAMIAGLFLISPIAGLVGGGALLMIGGLALARLRAGAR